MSLFPDARPQIIAEANRLNNIALKMSDIVFQVPTPASGGTTTKNTTVVLRASPSAPYTDSVPVNYDRLDLATVFAHTPVNTYAKVRAFKPATIHDLIPALNLTYGTEFSANDIEDGPLTLVDGGGTALIKAKPGSFTWLGEFTVTVAPGDMNLEREVVSTNLNGLNYPSGQSVKGQAEVYSYRYDCSAYGDVLEGIEVPEGGLPVNQVLADFVSDITGDTWVLDGSVDFSLEGAVVKYNGTNSLEFVESNKNFDYLIEIDLSASCANFAGTLRFHYNLEASIDNVTTVQAMSFNVNSMTDYDPDYSTIAAYQTTPRYNPYLATAYNDYSPVANTLKSVPWQAAWTSASNANALAMANALKSIDGLPWIMNTNAPTAAYNLYAVYVRYNGPIANAPKHDFEGFEYRDGFTHVMLLHPPYQQQSNLWYGIGVVYYNA